MIVTHNMQQAVRVSDMTAFYNAEAVEGGTGKVGYLVEFNETEKIFNSLNSRPHRTTFPADSVDF